MQTGRKEIGRWISVWLLRVEIQASVSEAEYFWVQKIMRKKFDLISFSGTDRKKISFCYEIPAAQLYKFKQIYCNFSKILRETHF